MTFSLVTNNGRLLFFFRLSPPRAALNDDCHQTYSLLLFLLFLTSLFHKRSRFMILFFFLSSFFLSKRACTFVFIFISLTQLLLRDDIVCWQENKSTQKAEKIESVFFALLLVVLVLLVYLKNLIRSALVMLNSV